MERLTVKVAVYAIFEREGKILFLRRFNTGWMDGKFTPPAGHVDPGEKPISAMLRELKEEVAITATEADLQFLHVAFEQDKYIDFYFKVFNWQGEPKLNEPEKSDALEWLDLDQEQDADKIIPRLLGVIKQAQTGSKFSETDNVD